MDQLVSIRKASRDIREGVRTALEDLGGLGRYVTPGDRVVLKPNMNGTECVTDLRVVEAVIELLNEISVTDIAIAESTFGDERTTHVYLSKLGYFGLAAKWGIDLVNINASDVVEVPVEQPLVKESIRVAKEIVEADKLINLPVMKVHYATGITACLKNMKGILVGDEKRAFHEAGLDDAIVDLNRTIRPTLNVVDATESMERMGPRGGDPVHLGLILAGENGAYVDFVVSRIMGYTLAEVRHLERYRELTGLKLDAVETVGESIDSIKRDFIKVDCSDVFPPDLTVENRDACSSCVNALILSLRIATEINMSGRTVYLGSGFDGVKPPPRSVAFGKCAITSCRDAETIVPGCPPYPFELGRRLSVD
jgi:uncharacterized protein (DUF362 family)